MTAKRALLSVYDKTSIVEFATGLAELGFELVSTGGTATVLKDAGLDVVDVADVTGFPAMLDDRVKTLHPNIHAGILADLNNPEHVAQLDKYDIPSFGLVVVNLYPFESDPSIKLIDVGGPTMLRGAAKNHGSIGVVSDPEDYREVLKELQENGELSDETRLTLAIRVFDITSTYDNEIANWLEGQRKEP